MLTKRCVAPGILVAALIMLAVPSDVLAGERDHDSGFFLRLSAGGGAANIRLEGDTDEAELSGPSGDVNFAIGGIIRPNLALHATLFGWATTDPDVEFNDVGATLDGDLGLGAFGIGVTYYLMPANAYLSASVGTASLTFDAGDVQIESDNGIAVDLTIGKEWWVGRNWGIGVAGTLGLQSVPDSDIDENWKGTSVGLRFSATMN